MVGRWFGWTYRALAAVAACLAVALLRRLARPSAFFAGGRGRLRRRPRPAAPGELRRLVRRSLDLREQILPLLLAGVLVAGLLLGRPGHEGLIPASGSPARWAATRRAPTSFAAVAGAFMYFATLTEVPILQGLLGSGMGQGPALALLLAGPALSLPSILVLRSIMGLRRTLIFLATGGRFMAAITGRSMEPGR